MAHAVALNFADGKTLFINVNHNELLVNAAIRQGIKIPIDCREGVCGTCQGLCESGLYELEYVDEDALSERDLAQRKILACQTKVQSNAAFYFDHDSSICHAKDSQKIATVVKSVQLVSPNTAVLHLDASALGQTLQFLPGQYAHLHVPNTDQARSYSFANRPNEHNQLQFLIRLLPNGVMSDYLREACQVGQTIMIEAPLGSFYLREVQRPLVFVAGGTGLSSFLGMLDEMAQAKASTPVHLYYGITHEQDLCELERLQAYQEALPNFEYQLIVSQASEQWRGDQGYVQQHFHRTLWHAQGFDMYVCGPPPMVEAVQGWLDENAIADYRFYSEKFVSSQSSHAKAAT